MKEEVKQVYADVSLQALSRLFEMICNCRRDYPELEQNLAPSFHLEDCPYRVEIEKLDLKFENE